MRALLPLLVAPLLMACGPLQILDKFVPFWGYELKTGVEYGKLGGQVMDVYRPHGEPPAGGFPMVVFFYGGRWQGYFHRDEFRFLGDAFTDKGYVAVVPEYRQYPEVTFPGFVEDGAKAVAYAKAHAKDWGANGDRLFVGGHSAGAHVAIMLASDETFLAKAGAPGAIKAAAGLAGPYDFMPFQDEDIKLIMGPSKQWPTTQPINYVDGQEPPMFLALGLDDNLVGAHNHRNMAAKLKEAGRVVETKEYAGVDHYKLIAGFAAPLRALVPVREDVLKFFEAQR